MNIWYSIGHKLNIDKKYNESILYTALISLWKCLYTANVDTIIISNDNTELNSIKSKILEEYDNINKKETFANIRNSTNDIIFTNNSKIIFKNISDIKTYTNYKVIITFNCNLDSIKSNSLIINVKSY